MQQRPLERLPADVPVSRELIAPLANGIDLCYQTFGDPDGVPLLLVMGLSGPMTWWPEELCRGLVAAGFHVIRYDNRDVGRSTQAAGRVGRTDLVRAFVGAPTRAPYSIADLADDGFGLLDHLGLPTAHVAGVSMGGMIAQTMALRSPERVQSLTSISSSTGNRRVGRQHPVLLPALLKGRGPGLEPYVEGSLAMWRLIGSPQFPQSEQELRSRAVETYERGVSRAGVLRQMLAVLTQEDRSRALANLTVPTLVLHGLADRMVDVSGGRALAHAVPGARIHLIHGWGHDLPAELHPSLIGAIRSNAAR